MIPLARNSPCPCGSGMRYKECHGLLAGAIGPLADDAMMRRQLAAALAAQQAGRYAEAKALYEGVIAQYPRTFDAVHMLGVAHYQLGEFERAHELVCAALAILPDASAEHNLQLIDAVLEQRLIERELCAEALPRLAKRCIAPPTLDDGWPWRGTTLDLIVSKTEMHDAWVEPQRLVRWLGATATFWRYRQTSLPATSSLSIRTIDPDAGVFPQERVAIFYGTDISPAAWYPQALAMDVALYCEAYDASVFCDRIPELSREGRTPLRLLFASPSLAERTRLCGRVVNLSDAGSNR